MKINRCNRTINFEDYFLVNISLFHGFLADIKVSIDLICNVVIELGSLYVNLCTSKIAIKFVGTFSPNLICETSTFFLARNVLMCVQLMYLEETWLCTLHYAFCGCNEVG